ncbi:MAG: class I SAM-dependent methyltransferase [Candidatus Omnitrophica bacterium]|nr:class I SAM-dependent methyltransferase [Candidatus Omnitrophota bacterium]
MRASLKILYHKIVSKVKSLDKATSYKLGDILRNLTDVNTRRYWDRIFSKTDEFLRDFPYEPLKDILPKDRSFSLLDIGCAMGDGLNILKTYFPKAHFEGADISAVGIEKAKVKTKDINYFVLDLKTQEPPRKYDFITLIHTLEHFNDPFAIVDKCLKFTNEALIVRTPYIEQFDNPRLYLSGEHRHLFNKHTFEKYNCEVLHISDHIEAGGYKYILYRIEP